MSFNFTFRRTSDLRNEEIKEIIDIFNVSFNRKISNKQLISKYCNNKFGYSFHCLYRDEFKKLTGVYTFVPKVFLINSELKYVLQTLDTCFPYKGIAFLIKESVLKLVNFAQSYINPISFIYGFPNESFEKLSVYIFEWNKLGSLITYIDFLPLLSFIFSYSRNFNEKKFDISLQLGDLELKSRYNSFLWKKLNLGNNQFIYFWFSAYLIPIQFFNFKAIRIRKIINIFFNNPFFFLRLLIPSITSTTSKKLLLPWHFKLDKFEFQLYLKVLNEEINVDDLYASSSFIWNDVP